MTPAPTVLIVLPFHASRDAVANDARLQARALRRAGFEARLYADQSTPEARGELIAAADFERLIQQPETLLIYHMCVFWEPLDALLARARCKIVVKYHNITPSRFFGEFDPGSAHATRAGLAQAKRVLPSARLTLVVATSLFTRDELAALCGRLAAPVELQAPFVPLSELTDAPEDVDAARALQDGRVHLLFVGRCVPHKGHLHLLGVANSYKELYGEKFCLTAVGNVATGAQPYAAKLEALIRELGLGDQVRLVPGLAPAQLLAHFHHSQVALVLSEHEGFCVPVVEAQTLGTPVVALARAAVPDTLGDGQILIQEPDYDLFASAAHAVATQPALRQALVARGRRNAARFAEPTLAEQLVASVRRLTAAPHAAGGR